MRMDTPSPLCRPCRAILKGEAMECMQRGGPIEGRGRDHHLTYQSLTEAVQSKCYICTIFWDFRLSQNTATEPNEQKGTEYFLWRQELEEGHNTLSIKIRSKGVLGKVGFNLIDAESPKHGRLFLSRTLAQSTSSKSSLGLVYGWYNSCRALHKSCRQLLKIPKWYPTRLVDIGRPGDLNWTLHICADEAMISPNYMTLSYRWAEVSPWNLTQGNLDELRRGKLIHELPQTFQDAVTVARRFSIRYLWVDSLCIVQDSQEDWERESSTMRDVYANSSCNICATASSNPSEGLFRVRQNDIVQPGLIVMNTNSTNKKHYIFDERYWDRQVTNTVLNKRGWVFQERLLAPRVLHFARHQVLWECFTEHKCEVFPVGIPLHKPLKSFDAIFTKRTRKESALSMDAGKLWRNIVKEYTQCALTRSSDRLVALSGLARLFQDATGDEYLYGLWRSRLLESMIWRAVGPMTKHSCEYLAPSWSWACGSGSVSFYVTGPDDGHLISVLDTRTHQSSPEITGRLSGGFIKIKGPVVQATCTKTVHSRWPDYVTTNKQYQLRLETWPPDSDEMTLLGSFRRLISQSIAPPKPDPRLISAWLSEDFCVTNLDVGRKLLLLGISIRFIGDGYNSHHKLVGLILEPTSSPPELFVRTGIFNILSSRDIAKFGVYVNQEDRSFRLNERVKPTVITIV